MLNIDILDVISEALSYNSPGISNPKWILVTYKVVIWHTRCFLNNKASNKSTKLHSASAKPGKMLHYLTGHTQTQEELVVRGWKTPSDAASPLDPSRPQVQCCCCPKTIVYVLSLSTPPLICLSLFLLPGQLILPRPYHFLVSFQHRDH